MRLHLGHGHLVCGKDVLLEAQGMVATLATVGELADQPVTKVAVNNCHNMANATAMQLPKQYSITTLALPSALRLEPSNHKPQAQSQTLKAKAFNATAMKPKAKPESTH